MRCTFYRTEKINVIEFENIIGKMMYDLETIKKQKESSFDLECYVYDLATLAQPLDSNAGMYFWGLDNPENMPGDARVEYFYKPTYIASSILMKAILICPELLTGEVCWEHADECSRLLNEILPKALLGCTGRGFAGHGYDSTKGLVETMELFVDADVHIFVERYPDICPEFTKLVNETLAFFESKVDKDGVKGSWGEDYTERARDILKIAQR